ncbi:oligopeptide ABC transporter permease [Pontibacillus marinus]|uniref:Peptide ABC transporter permease n=1 Tax=Pontibacillus marinus BH030004 = DSM 16465 TaxID=1385511 RepID=A0A0A5FYX7_9BACI|nr:oligopeptide ABC transporter permease [Pontibacillus marinus]KGX86031.1 peptide ABC transporter permease [Pontibacillus marinus BH030004 = DSM 16465]
MARYIFQRIVYMFITMLLIATFSFFLMKLLPGSPLMMEDKLTEEQAVIIKEKYGLNDPVPVQYVNYLANLAQGDLGISFQQDNRGVTKILIERAGPSIQLGAQALIFGLAFGLLLGIFAALYHNSPIDYGSTFLAVIGKSIPSFVFAGLLQYYIGVKLGWLPVAFWEGFEYTIMPTIALAMFPIAIAARFMRTEMLEVLGSDFITTARAKGVNRLGVLFKHGLRNALIPLVTIIGPMAIALLTGNLVIENIFAIPGIGDTFVQAVMTNDFPIIMGFTLITGFLFIFIILIVDLLYGVIDPRIRLAGGEK